MREAIPKHEVREEGRESFRQDGLRGWQEYQETGLHVPSEEVTDWLKGWGTAKEKAVPECRKDL
jgi:predicted transcriptional regulator